MAATRRLRLLPVLLAALLVVACDGGGSVFDDRLAVATLTRVPAEPVATRTPAAATATQATAPAPTAEPTATATPVPPTPVPPPLELVPPQIPQGGAAVVYLNETAASATATFEGRQYPMLRDGERWWAIVGVGALLEPGLYPVFVSYTPLESDTAVGVVVSLAIIDVEFPVEYIELDSATAALLAPEIVQAEIARRAALFSGFTAQRLWSGAFLPPGVGAISSRYGEGRSYNGGPVTDYHHGTDFIGDTGSPVTAAAAGRVVFAEELRVRGNTIIVDHGAGVFTAYHHLSAFEVAVGDEVAAGQRIGAIGATGLVTGPHLHWEVVVRGVEVDGELWLQGTAIGP